MLLTLDKLATRYGMLPSQALVEASTLDLYIMDAALSYEYYHHKKNNGEVAQDYSVDELKNLLDGAKRNG